ncbi:hypothetical protein FDC45_13950 [Clostridium botulinum]|uniref:Uncharacterized protein n=1 Tax=Clostridium botulinum TaxID=1491 RepID=A0A846J773_CLOBO|nr:hypothetical protein [Clostridium botulinum]ACA56667.1 conserved hypothetical protein [Clostridium botulinum A3 str. Loch Maree]NFH65481.1 hypothetical protein [Clostridium botulinum]NFJ09749.1 hypothetical protein [Clostridium botulinum]NFK14729.1 hypothetical protein [Clostridium botulinum]NFM94277.1 hypothetical protein [Clostridium botulinum]
MTNKQENFKNNINKSQKMNEDINKNLNIEKGSYDNPEFDINYKENEVIEENNREIQDKSRRKQIEKPLKIFGIICIIATMAAVIFTDTAEVDTSQSAKNALKNKVSTSVSAGIVLLSKDENLESKDYTITHKSNVQNTKIWVWDYAAEDGDYVQVIVDGTPLGDAFMIKHKPKEFTVPAVAKVQIKGIKDGGGGITYGVRYDITGTSYFNDAPEGGFNTYTLTKE